MVLSAYFPDAVNVSPTQQIPRMNGLTDVMIYSAFLENDDGQRWLQVSGVLHKWITGPMSVGTWGGIQAAAYDVLLELLKKSKSPSIQRVLEASVGVSEDVTKPGYWVYALVSPLWGKCYIGGTGYTRPRCLLERWIEHIRMAKLWMSNTSQHRFRSRQSQVYAAMCSIEMANVVMIKIASPQPKELFQAEAFYTRKLQPVFNTRNVEDIPNRALPAVVTMVADDITVAANRLLRKNNPKLKPAQWASLVTSTALLGERALAVKLARQVRESCPGLSKLCALPHVLVPCAIPKSRLAILQKLLDETLLFGPGYARTPQFSVQLAVGRVSWKRSPTLDSVVAPSFPKISSSLECRCGQMSTNLVHGHVCTRQWGELQICQQLHQLLANKCLSYRLYLPLQNVLCDIQAQVSKKLRSCGLDKDAADIAADRYVALIGHPLEDYWGTIPPHLQLSNIQAALRPIARAGLVFVRLDRNPGRVILVCRNL